MRPGVRTGTPGRRPWFRERVIGRRSSPGGGSSSCPNGRAFIDQAKHLRAADWWDSRACATD
eukprot:scaffold1867_cov247-Pinguiococcus_pyrenoidosus.AAC.30